MSKMLFKRSFFISLLILSSNALATDQEPETFLYKGEKLDLYDTPLNSYFTDQHKQPNVYEITKTGCSAAWRGYHGSWEVRDKNLYLIDLGWPCSITLNSKIIPQIFFPKKKLPIKATWYTGYTHALHNKNMLLMRFIHGSLIKEEILPWPPSKYGYNGSFANNAYWSHGTNNIQEASQTASAENPMSTAMSLINKRD